MSIIQISEEEFNSLDIERMGFFPEKSWFRSSKLGIAGVVIRDPVDRDWSYVILAREEDGVYRYIEGQTDISNQTEAEKEIFTVLSNLDRKGRFDEELYLEPEEQDKAESSIIISNIDDEIKKYFKKNPEKLYDLAPRKFEELIASILKDLGFDVELTQTTRDGGRDIIAYVRTAVGNYLTHIECKRYARDNKVGVGIIREVVGVHHLKKATKSIIVTTSFFSSDALKEAKAMENHLDLKDFNDIKELLQKY